MQFDSIVHPSQIGSEHFLYCHDRGRFHSPYAFYLLTSFNNLCLVLNSSINFVVYCMAGKRFRATLVELMCHVGLPWSNHATLQHYQGQHRRRTHIELTTANGAIGMVEMDPTTATRGFSRHSINERTV